jgi:hypothetical protein
VTHAEHTVKRRPHQLLRDDRFGLGDAGVGLIEGSLCLIDSGLRPDLARGQFLGGIVRIFRLLGLRLVVGEVALIRLVV